MEDRLEDWLNEYNAIIDTYHSLQWNEGDKISELMKNLSVVLSHLEHLRNSYHNMWIGESMKENGVSAGERRANKEVPQLYQLRRIMTAGYRILDSMRSNISYIKHEK
jgi:hypothetical protein